MTAAEIIAVSIQYTIGVKVVARIDILHDFPKIIS
jgi:hypothetical protein